ncbi:hypothetical protein B0H11DRAFT_471054 [Mycena galericulata]|nr:hypothetical protein B0H11DRAFT_471054 [Mycena galericulata]
MISSGLPTELEREIFETAALQCPQMIPTLLLVACRVHIWIEPLMYRVLSLKGDVLSLAPEIAVPKPDSLFRAGVRSLLLHHFVASEDMLVVLRICAKTSNLAVYNDHVNPELFPYISAMPLTKLAIDLRRLLGDPMLLLDRSGGMLSHLTHLDITTAVGQDEPWARWSGLSQLPILTHLSFNYQLPSFVVLGALSNCRALKVLLICWDTPPILYNHPPISDPRFAMIAYKNPVGDWERGAMGGQDFWKRADAFFDKKRKQEIDAADIWIR